MSTPPPGPRLARLPLLALGVLAVLTGMWGGLARLGWAVPAAFPGAAALHGPLMVSGFLGTLVGLERAAALDLRWAYAAPLATALGGAAFATGLPGDAGPWLFVAGSVAALAVSGVLLRRAPALFTLTTALGMASWTVGNTLWAVGWPVWRVVPWWAGFLVLLIAGERLDLTRVLGLSAARRTCFVAALTVFVAGIVVGLAAPDAGMRLAGLGMVALALWLGRHDLARRTVRQTGVARFMAASLLTGYAWLALAGVLAALCGATVAGPRYDAVLHALFLGFVFSMIFGHAPVIFPGVLGLPLAFRPRFYVHLVGLHASLMVRLAGDLLLLPEVRRWGALLNTVVVLVFLANTVSSLRRSAAG